MEPGHKIAQYFLPPVYAIIIPIAAGVFLVAVLGKTEASLFFSFIDLCTDLKLLVKQREKRLFLVYHFF